jgi:hypothetical protein
MESVPVMTEEDDNRQQEWIRLIEEEQMNQIRAGQPSLPALYAAVRHLLDRAG